MSQLKRSKHLKIPLALIEIATNDFEVCIGKGGYGMVYKGEIIVSGKLTTVAIKRLNEKYGQGLKEFLTEIQLLSGQNHPNLINLVGYGDEGVEKMIVYEYAENGSLDNYLRRSSSRTTRTLTWLERLKICVGAARGLDYLHNHVGKHQMIIHRDIKSANILIDENWDAKVSDFGLSKLTSTGLYISEVISNACGTRGYCEPEYYNTGIVTKECDVYSFGMVLFEVLCGRLCTVRYDDGILLSCSLAKHYYEQKRLDDIVDPCIMGEMNVNVMNKFAAVAYGCLYADRGQRLTIDCVLKELEESLQLQIQISRRSGSKSYSKKKLRYMVGVVWREFVFLVLSSFLILLYSERNKFFGYLETHYRGSWICEKVVATFQVLTDLVPGLSMSWEKFFGNLNLVIAQWLV